MDEASRTRITLMAQAPSENGVRKSGIHWVDRNGKVRHPGGTFLDKYLRSIGYSVGLPDRQYLRPYTTNVLHCWTGRSGKRDRSPSKEELRNCKIWWLRELQIIRPKVLVLLGKPASEAFASVCGVNARFVELLKRQGEKVVFDDIVLHRFVVPHPTAPYPGISEIYSMVFKKIGSLIAT